MHVVNSHGDSDRAEEGRRSDRRNSANSLWERDDSCMSVGASIVDTGVRVGVCWSGCVSRNRGVHGSGVKSRSRISENSRISMGHSLEVMISHESISTGPSTDEGTGTPS